VAQKINPGFLFFLGGGINGMYNVPMLAHITKWTNYRDARKATYEYRCATRYKAVAERLFALGLRDCHTVVDVGAGSCQFGRYLRERGWRGIYSPVDAVVDGVDLETWLPAWQSDFVVSIEVLEHVLAPMRLLAACSCASRVATVITTPNPEAVDVIKCDPTHVSVVTPSDLAARMFTVERHSWFGVADDTLLAWRAWRFNAGGG
jgi:hypothetical protein